MMSVASDDGSDRGDFLREQIAWIDRAIAETHRLRAESDKFVSEQRKLIAEQTKLYVDPAMFIWDPWFACDVLVISIIGGAIVAVIDHFWK